jgi:hypothetical protein
LRLQRCTLKDAQNNYHPNPREFHARINSAFFQQNV